MQLRYGSFLLPANSAIITTAVQTARNAQGAPVGRTERWNVQCEVTGSTQAAIATAFQQVRNALAASFRDLVFIRDDGGTAMALTNAASTSGVVIVDGPNMTGDPVGRGWVNGLTYTFTAEASYTLPATSGSLFDLQETIEMTGGGPLIGHLQPVNGRPIKQVIYQQTPYKATQSGTASGPIPYPTPSPPLWPGAIQQPATRIRRTPKRSPDGVRVFETAWSYEFESVTPLIGLPNVFAG